MVFHPLLVGKSPHAGQAPLCNICPTLRPDSTESAGLRWHVEGALVIPIESILRTAVRDALRMHRLLGNSVATVKNGKVVLIPANEIPID